MINPYFNIQNDPNYVEKTLGIENIDELEDPVELLRIQKIFELKEKPVGEDNLQVAKKFWHVDLKENLANQVLKNQTTKKGYGIGALKDCVNSLYKEGEYDQAIHEMEWLLKNSKVKLSSLYFLRMLYAKGLANSKEDRESRINNLIKLEKMLTKYENNLNGINKKDESELVLNILEDCKDLEDEDLFSRMIKFIDKYYSRGFVTI